MFEQTFKNIDDILHKDAGCGSELDYVEQTSWILFLKYLDDLEKDRATAAELTGKSYTPIIDKKYQWTVWATPKGKDGKLDHHKALTGDDLTDFVNSKLFSPVVSSHNFSGHVWLRVALCVAADIGRDTKQNVEVPTVHFTKLDL